MAFTRKFLADHGVPAEQIDAIMDERQRTLTGYVPKDDVAAQIAAAVEEAKKAFAAPPVTETDEYKALRAQLDMRIALDGEEYAGIKPKFRETVYNMIDHADGAAPVADQLGTIREKYEEYFTPTEPERKPQFGAPVEGAMPTGNKGPRFSDSWDFVPKR